MADDQQQSRSDGPADPLAALDEVGRLLGEPLLAARPPSVPGEPDGLDILVAGGGPSASWPDPPGAVQPSPEVAAELDRIARRDEPVDEPVDESLDEATAEPGDAPVLAPSAPRPAPAQRVTPSLPSPVRPRRRRGLIRRLLGRSVALVVIVGLLGGGVVAVRRFVLEPRWSAEVGPLADEIAAARGLSFTEAVDVVELPVAEYAVRLAEITLGLGEATVDQVAGEWRAVGLLTGVLDLEQVGRSALPDAPAVYEPGTGRVLVAAGLGADLRTFALHRALAVALLDQVYDWSGALDGVAPAAEVGTRTLVEADALETALSLVVEAERLAIGGQLIDLYSRLGVPPAASPFATTVAARLGVATWPYFRGLAVTDRETTLSRLPVADADVLDLGRLVAGEGQSGPVGPDTRGLLYWYHVLAARIDDDLAWRVALGWRTDAVTVIRDVDRVCVAGFFESSAADLAPAAFGEWAAASSSPVTLEVSELETGVRVSINVCDPGARVATNDGASRLSLGAAPLRSEQLRRLREVRPELSARRLACAVLVGDPVTLADERGVIDAVDGWPAPSGHEAGDPDRAECVAL